VRRSENVADATSRPALQKASQTSRHFASLCSNSRSDFIRRYSVDRPNGACTVHEIIALNAEQPLGSHSLNRDSLASQEILIHCGSYPANRGMLGFIDEALHSVHYAVPLRSPAQVVSAAPAKWAELSKAANNKPQTSMSMAAAQSWAGAVAARLNHLTHKCKTPVDGYPQALQIGSPPPSATHWREFYGSSYEMPIPTSFATLGNQ
jgi:hypothetical protein